MDREFGSVAARAVKIRGVRLHFCDWPLGFGPSARLVPSTRNLDEPPLGIIESNRGRASASVAACRRGQRPIGAVSMTVYPVVSVWILVLTAVTLFWVASTDLREFKVRNELVVVLACLYVVYALFSGTWVSMQWNFAFALLMLVGGVYAYSLQQIGGGDLKLLTVAFLWTGPWLAAPFVILLLIFVLIYYLAARLGFAAARPTSAGLRIPLAPSLAGALIGVFALGLVAPHR
jgi:prepilin peptidase CpaA